MSKKRIKEQKEKENGLGIVKDYGSKQIPSFFADDKEKEKDGHKKRISNA